MHHHQTQAWEHLGGQSLWLTPQSHRHIQLLVQLKGVVGLVEQELLPAALEVSGCSDSHHHVVEKQQSLLAEGERLGGVLVGQLALRCRGPDGV